MDILQRNQVGAQRNESSRKSKQGAGEPRESLCCTALAGFAPALSVAHTSRTMHPVVIGS